MRLTIGIIAIVLTIIFGGIYVLGYAFWGRGTYFGHTGYCAETKLTYFHNISIGLLGILLAIILNYIAIETFSLFGRQHKIYNHLLILFLFPLVYLTYQVVQYPYINRAYGFLAQSGRSEGAHNPMMFFGAIYAVVLGWTVLRFHMKTGLSGKRAIIGYMSVSIFLLTDVAMYLTAKYIPCFG